MRMIINRFRSFWILYLLVGGAVACSFRSDARAQNMAGLDELFVGFRLGEGQEEVLAKARRAGISVECAEGEGFDLFCSSGFDPSPRHPALSFGFRGGRVVSLVRPTRREARKPPLEFVTAKYREAFGRPVLDGPLNPYLHAMMWTSADATLLGIITCPIPADEAACGFSIDQAPSDGNRRMIADWRGMVERTQAGEAGRTPPR